LFFEALIADGFPERHDCALLTSKGFSSRAIRDLIDKIGGTDEPVQFFALHDCDGYGTKILETLRFATPARPDRKVEILDFGLNVEEVLALADEGRVEIERIRPKRRVPVAEYAAEHEAWFQRHRCELNALTTSDFIRLLDSKMAEFGTGKVIPPDDILRSACDSKIASIIREREVARILAEANIDGRVDDALRRLRPQITRVTRTLRADVEADLSANRRQPWDAVVSQRATSCLREELAAHRDDH
jgi:hypothetical protein